MLETMKKNSLMALMSFLVMILFSFAMSSADVAYDQIDHGNQSGQMFPRKQQVVKNLDLERYSGRWYEIAKYPGILEPNGENTRATYAIGSNGTLDILNETFKRGKRITIKGYAYKSDPRSDDAKFMVRLEHVPVVGDYWVLYVDSEYKYAIVGHPLRIALYILSRENKMDDQVYQKLRQVAKEQGYIVSLLIKTKHTDPPPP